MRALPHTLLLLTLVLAQPLAAASAHAADEPAANAEAEALVKRGNDLRRAGDDQNAVPLLAKAYELDPSPRNAVQLGLAEQAIGRWADSDRHLTEAMKAKQDPWIGRNRAAIEDALNRAKTHVGRVEITGEPAGAEVLVGGRSVGQLPLGEPVRVSAGTVDIELRAVGYRPMLRSLRIEGGQYQPVVMRLEAGSGPAMTSSGSLGLSGAAAPSPVRIWAERGAWLGGALSLGFGTYHLLGYNSDVKKFNQRGCFESEMGAYLPGGNGAGDDGACQDLQDGYDGSKRFAYVGFIAAGAFAATGLVLHLMAPDAGGREQALASLPTCAPSFQGSRLGVGLVCSAGF